MCIQRIALYCKSFKIPTVTSKILRITLGYLDTIGDLFYTCGIKDDKKDKQRIKCSLSNISQFPTYLGRLA